VDRERRHGSIWFEEEMPFVSGKGGKREVFTFPEKDPQISTNRKRYGKERTE